MKKLLRNIAILLAPFLLMIIINELVRPIIKETPYSIAGVTAINSNIQTPEKCSWNCHNHTGYCQQHHTTFTKPYFDITDSIYYGTIGALKSTGNYALANIIFLVILLPLLMFYLLVKSIDMQIEVNKLKRK